MLTKMSVPAKGNMFEVLSAPSVPVKASITTQPLSKSAERRRKRNAAKANAVAVASNSTMEHHDTVSSISDVRLVDSPGAGPWQKVHAGKKTQPSSKMVPHSNRSTPKSDSVSKSKSSPKSPSQAKAGSKGSSKSSSNDKHSTSTKVNTYTLPKPLPESQPKKSLEADTVVPPKSSTKASGVLRITMDGASSTKSSTKSPTLKTALAKSSATSSGEALKPVVEASTKVPSKDLKLDLPQGARVYQKSDNDLDSLSKGLSKSKSPSTVETIKPSEQVSTGTSKSTSNKRSRKNQVKVFLGESASGPSSKKDNHTSTTSYSSVAKSNAPQSNVVKNLEVLSSPVGKQTFASIASSSKPNKAVDTGKVIIKQEQRMAVSNSGGWNTISAKKSKSTDGPFAKKTAKEAKSTSGLKHTLKIATGALQLSTWAKVAATSSPDSDSDSDTSGRSSPTKTSATSVSPVMAKAEVAQKVPTGADFPALN